MLRSTLFIIYAIASTVVIFATCLWLVFLGRKGAFLGCYIWAKNIMLAAEYILGISYVVKGQIPQHPAIFAAKHQSAWETMLFLTIIKKPVYVLKRELGWIPFFNIAMRRAGYVFVNRSKRGGAMKDMVDGVQRAVAEGNSIIIFPEGTRTAPGAMPNYKPGIAVLYANLPNVPIIPVALNSGMFWPRNSFIKKPGVVTVEFLEPVEPGLSKSAFMERLETVIEGAVA